MKRNTVIVIAGIFLPMCFAALSQQRGTGELRPSNARVAERATEKSPGELSSRPCDPPPKLLDFPVKNPLRETYEGRVAATSARAKSGRDSSSGILVVVHRGRRFGATA